MIRADYIATLQSSHRTPRLSPFVGNILFLVIDGRRHEGRLTCYERCPIFPSWDPVETADRSSYNETCLALTTQSRRSRCAGCTSISTATLRALSSSYDPSCAANR